MDIIEVEQLTKIYRQQKKQAGFLAACKDLFKANMTYKTAVDNVSFQVKEGDIIGLLGSNGAGKTTILKILSGILYPTSGKVLVNGFIPYERKEEYKKSIAMITGQKNQMIWDLPAIDTILWLKEIYGLEDKTFKGNLDQLIDVFQAESLMELQVRRMSLGQRMKVELIASMLHCPKVVFLDEPTIGLDIMAQKELRKYIKKYNEEQNATIILTSHNLADVEELCNNVILIKDGSVTHNTSLQQLIHSYCDYKIFELHGLKEGIERSSFIPGMEMLKENSDETIIKVSFDIWEDALKYLWSNYMFKDINIKDADINDIIEKAFKK